MDDHSVHECRQQATFGNAASNPLGTSGSLYGGSPQLDSQTPTIV